MKRDDGATTRREFVQAVLVAGGSLTLAFSLPGIATPSESKDPLAPNAWLRLSREKGIQFYMDRVEMGQGVITSLPVLIAEELGVEPAAITVEFAPAASEFANPEYGLQITGGSNSLKGAYLPLREAASSTRLLLEQAAARHWNCSPSEVETRNGRIFQVKTGQNESLVFFAPLAEGLKLPPPQLKRPDQFVYIGKSLPRPDNDAKIQGKAQFGIDVELPGMSIAILIRPPHLGAVAKRFDASKVLGKGVDKVLMTRHGVALVGPGYWSLREAAKDLVIEWSPGEHSSFSSEEFGKTLMKAIATTDGKTFNDKGDAEGNFKKAQKKVELDFLLPYLAHATLEPQNSTVRMSQDRCEIWAPTQCPDLAQKVGMHISGLGKDQVFVHTTFLGGGFGRRLAQDYVEEALEIAKATELPIKLIWSREDDTAHDDYRPMTAHRVRASLNDKNEISSWYHKIAAQSLFANMMQDMLPTMAPTWFSDRIRSGLGSMASGMIDALNFDTIMIEGATPIEYRTEAETLVFEAVKAPVPLGSWRSVAHSYTAFIVESVIDQLAHVAGTDPLAFRRGLLSKKPRHLNVLNLVADKADWGKRTAPIYQGLAVHQAFNTYVAQVVDIHYEKGKPTRILRVTCAVDCGLAVNPDTIQAQMEGGIIFALSQALHQKITFSQGKVEQSSFDDYPLARMQEIPEITVHIVASQESPTGVGEPGVPPLVPALANALFAATGVRQLTNPLKLSPPS